MAEQNFNEGNKNNGALLNDSQGISNENYENNFADIPQAENNTTNDYDLRDRNDWATTEADFSEETAAEVAPGLGYLGRADDRPGTFDRPTEEGTGGRVMGTIALALSILSLFYSPVLFGAAGIIIGYMARRRGANGLGNWAMGIGVVSLIIGLFIAPFFY